MSLEYGILGFLNYAPMTGYELTKAFDSSLEFFWHAQSSHIYLELKKLEAKGLIEGETVEQTTRPNKRLFSLTPAGRDAFLGWLAQGPGAEATQFKSAFLMKVFFGGSQSPAQTAALLRQFRSDCGAYLERTGSIPAAIDYYGVKKTPYQTLCWQFTADFGLRLIKTYMDWAQDCIRQLEALAEKEGPL